MSVREKFWNVDVYPSLDGERRIKISFSGGGRSFVMTCPEAVSFANDILSEARSPFPMTSAKMRIVRAVIKIRKDGGNPSYHDVAVEAGVSKSTAIEHIQILLKRGILLRTDDARSLRLAEGLILV